MQPLIDIVGEFRAVVQTLSTHRIGFAVCGGFAVATHGYARATKDIDLLVEAQAIEPAFAALKTLSFNLRAGPIDVAFGTRR